jgi:LmbE family N-acetylglucosaminyl deacetylase
MEHTTNNDCLLANRTLLVISPHADDETFGCAGTIAKAKALGSRVFLIYVSVANLQHYSAQYSQVEGTTRASELEEACRVMGVDAYEILYKDEYTHLRVDAIPRRDLMAKIERDADLAIDRVKPDVLLLPAVSFNQDHEAIFYAGFAACRPHLPQDKPFVKLVLTYDQPQLAWNHTPFHPNFYVDITEYLDVKLKAHACHRSQLRPEPSHASLANLERIARVRGSEVSVGAAEAFYCHRCLVG